MSIRLLLPGIVFLALTTGCRCDTSRPADQAEGARKSAQPEIDVPEPITIDPTVAKLVDMKPDEKTLPEFVGCLKDLASKQGWQQELADCKPLSFLGWDEARAVLIRSGQNQYVVILIKSWTFMIPGIEVQTAILLDHQGKFLDQVACEINSRLTRMDVGQFHTVIPGKPEADGAQLVIRLAGVNARGNWAHRVYHRGREANFYWGHDRLPQDQPTEWDTKGLCRIAILDGKFKVLFPGEKDAQLRP